MSSGAGAGLQLLPAMCEAHAGVHCPSVFLSPDLEIMKNLVEGEQDRPHPYQCFCRGTRGGEMSGTGNSPP